MCIKHAPRYLFDNIYRILGECLLISSLPGKALRTFVDLTCVLKAEPRKLEIKRRKPGFLLVSLPLVYSSNK